MRFRSIRGPLTLEGDFRALAPRVGRFSGDRLAASVTWDGERLVIGNLAGVGLGGSLHGEVEIWPTIPTRFAARVGGAGLGLEQLLELVGRRLPLSGDVTGDLRIEGVAVDASTWEGEGAVEIAPAPGREGLPAGGSYTVIVGSGMAEVRSPLAAAAEAELTMRLAVPLEKGAGNVELDLAGVTHDARASQLGALRVLEALGVELPGIVYEPIQGSGPVRAKVVTGARESVDLELDLAAGAWGVQPFDRAFLRMAQSDATADFERIELEHGGRSLRGRARLGLRPLEIAALEAQAEELDVTWLLAQLQVAAPLEGRISGQLSIRRGAEGLEGSGSVALSQGRYLGEAFDTAGADFEILADRVRFRHAELSGGAFTAAGSAEVDLANSRTDLRIDRAVVRLEELENLRGLATGLRGTAAIAGRLQFEGDAIGGTLQVHGEDWALQDQPLGPAEGELLFAGGTVTARLGAPAGGHWRADATWDWRERGSYRALARLDEMPLTFDIYGTTPTRFELTGDIRLVGAGADLADLEASGRIDALTIDLGTRALRSAAPFEGRYENRRLTVDPIVLTGRGTRVETRIEYDGSADQLQAAGEGEVDLGLLAAVLPDARASGTARIEFRADGPLAQPEVAGRVTVADGRLRWLGLPDTVEQIELQAIVDQRGARIAEYRAVLGGGELTGDGDVLFDGAQIGSYDLRINAQGVRLNAPEDFQGVYDGRMELQGGATAARLRGDLTLLRGLYEEEFDLGGLLGTGSRALVPADALDAPFEFGLDLRVLADGNVWLRNEVAQLEAEVDLQLTGTLERPELTGRVGLLEGGRLDFRDVRYDVESGSLDFVELGRINPYLTLVAKTTVQEYEILLRVDGPLDDFDYELTSNPTLPTQDIIALLATGNTLADIATQGRGSDFTGDLAANYFAGALTGRFQRQLERTLGLEKVQINPMLVVGETTDPTTRITVGKEVGDDVFIVFSQDLGSSEAQIYRVEWQTTRKIRLLAESTEAGSLAGDVRYTNRFWWRVPERAREEPTRPAAVTRPAGPQGARIVGSIAVLGLEGDERAVAEARVGLRVDDAFSRATMFRGAQRLRRWLVGEGHLLSEVRARASDDEGPGVPVDVVYTIAAGPEYQVEFSGVTRKEERKLRELLEALWAESLFQEDLFGDSLVTIRSFFQERGFYAVDARAEQRIEAGVSHVVLVVDRGDPVTVDAVRIEGGEQVPPERIREQMLTREPGLLGARKLDPARLQQDVAAVRAAYRDLGYALVEVDEPRISLSSDAQRAEIVLRVREGRRHAIAGIAFTPGLPFDEERLRGWSGLTVGDVFSPSALLGAESALRAAIDQQGHPEVRVQSRVVLDAGAASVLFDVAPGEAMRVARVEISGNEATREKIIAREIDLGPGDAISRDAMLRIQHRLYRLGIFRSVRVSHRAEDGGAPGRVLEVRVEEAKPLSMVLGGGFDSEAGLRLTYAMTHENVLGRDQRMSVQARGSSILRRVALSYEEERLFNRGYPGIATLFWEEREQTSFSVRRRGGSLRVDRRFTPAWSGWLRYNLQDDELYDVFELPPLDDRLETIQLGSLGATGRYDTRDDPFAPSRGTQINLAIELFAQPLLSEATFVRAGANYSRRWPLAGGTNFTTSARIGLADPYGDTRCVPLSQRFFAGGDSTVRGFARDELGPRLSELAGSAGSCLFPDIPVDALPVADPFIGGEASLIFNQEFRFPIWRTLHGVLFYDAGQVYLAIDDIDPSELRHVFGGGLRLLTPIGPLRLEYGAKLDRESGESEGELFLSIGTPF